MSERAELATFLRARRGGLHPADVGLPDSGRRRTPGLRREEVAMLAGVSVDYLIRLEQGRDVNPSPSVLAALAKALCLTDDERQHLTTLADVGRHPKLCPLAAPVLGQVAPSVHQLLDSLSRTPAFVVGPASHLLAWNPAWEQIAAPLGMLDGTAPNLARHVFTHPRARAVYPDWSAAADEQVSRLRAAEPRWGVDRAFSSLLAELSPLPDFASRWSAHAVAEKHRGVKRLGHPSAGELRLAYEVLLLPDDEQRLITWLPADQAATTPFRAALRDPFPAAPPQLRIVANP
ncbi:helix-turn-helix transcriptional regulator [Frankia tisae]|uniref:helix-turn-helix transcriptional regulator n=1 Tax=Frankia tisae TaxID=2950104 RepID=UPI0021C16C7A|nr:helix-turn-helix transcriptional regulator [Frankia tisae]